MVRNRGWQEIGRQQKDMRHKSLKSGFWQGHEGLNIRQFWVLSLLLTKASMPFRSQFFFVGGAPRVPQFVLWPGLLQGQKFSVSENIVKGWVWERLWGHTRTHPLPICHRMGVLRFTNWQKKGVTFCLSDVSVQLMAQNGQASQQSHTTVRGNPWEPCS